MKNFKISVIIMAIGLAFNATAMAENMSKNQYKSHVRSIESEYKVNKAGCDSSTSNAKDVCVSEAKAKQSVAKADLEVNYKPSIKTRYDARVAKADADYSIAIEKCDDKAGNDKDVCVKEAKATKVHQIADAKTQMKTKNANAEANEASGGAQAVANEKTGDANAKAAESKADARKDATKVKSDADYAVAKEKCDALSGSVKDKCISDVKLRFGQ
ncbi:MAG: hypothetical protein H7Z20_05495 [Bdellovibrio sp.]|nr:hypothetical protein [Methylotenera sp.]